LIPLRLLLSNEEVEHLLCVVEEALRASGLRCSRDSLLSAEGTESGADAFLVGDETLFGSRPPKRVPSILVEAQTDEVHERIRDAVRTAGGLAYRRFAGQVRVEALRPEINKEARARLRGVCAPANSVDSPR
jgi:hypothetical protein